MDRMLNEVDKDYPSLTKADEFEDVNLNKQLDKASQ